MDCDSKQRRIVRLLLSVMLLVPDMLGQSVANCETAGNTYSNGTATCTVCKDNLMPVWGGTQCCHWTCQTCGSAGECLTCPSGRYKLNSRCEYCPSGCKDCTSSAPTFCLSCSAGYYMVNMNSCQSCMPGCVKCNGPTECIECTTSEYFQEGTKCKPCLDGCSSCSDSSTCYTCSQRRFRKKSSECGYCGNSCVKCTSAAKCTKCESEYTVTPKDDGDAECIRSTTRLFSLCSTYYSSLLEAFWFWLALLHWYAAVRREDAALLLNRVLLLHTQMQLHIRTNLLSHTASNSLSQTSLW